MVTAQKAIDEMRDSAEKEAKLVLTEAEIRAEKLVFDAHTRVSKVDVSQFAKPRPVPRPSFLVVKNGSRACSNVCASMPTPVSRTAICA